MKTRLTDGDDAADDVAVAALADQVKHERRPLPLRGRVPEADLVVRDPEEVTAARPRLAHDPAQHEPAQRDGREHRDEHADDEDEREALDDRRPEVEQDEGRDERGHVRVEDRVPRPAEARLDGRTERSPAAQLLLRALEDEDVGVHRHAHREDERGDARERQRHARESEGGVREDPVGDERDARDQPRHAVVDRA